jgi:phage repressor protein C with HTH and peptisase S24 domain
MSSLHFSQAELGRRAGVSQATIAKLATGTAAGSKHLHAIARALETTPDYLIGHADDPAEGAAPRPTAATIAEHLDMVAIGQIDLEYGLGATFTDRPVEVEVIHFPRIWLEAITTSPPALLTWARGRGDSMMPTINDGDMVLLDRSQTRIVEQDALGAYTVGDLGAIKRLRIKGDRVVILSDNPTVPIDEEPIDEINIIARVIFVGKRL